jgi:hypothetical protein
LAVPAVAIASIELDPIFATIAAHREAELRKMRTGRVHFRTEWGTPEEDAAQVALSAAYEVLRDAECDLGNTLPTTLAGIIALLAYAEEYHVQAIELPEDPIQWHSHHDFFGTLVDDEVRDRFNGEPIKLPLTFWIMRNVREALQTLAVQS